MRWQISGHGAHWHGLLFGRATRPIGPPYGHLVPLFSWVYFFDQNPTIYKMFFFGFAKHQVPDFGLSLSRWYPPFGLLFDSLAEALPAGSMDAMGFLHPTRLSCTDLIFCAGPVFFLLFFFYLRLLSGLLHPIFLVVSFCLFLFFLFIFYIVSLFATIFILCIWLRRSVTYLGCAFLC